MTKIQIDVKNCGECPHFESERIYTSDSFDMLFKWTCTKAKRVITGCHDTWDKTPIPDWCPCKINDNKKKK